MSQEEPRSDTGRTTTRAHVPAERRALVTDVATSERLGRVRQRDTKPELVVRRLLHRLGHRFRVSNRDLPGSPDIANRAGRWAVFVHGCYWHSHTGCPRATVPKRNREFWEAKFAANRARDARAVSELRSLGFDVLTIWECETVSERRLADRLEAFFERSDLTQK